MTVCGAFPWYSDYSRTEGPQFVMVSHFLTAHNYPVTQYNGVVNWDLFDDAKMYILV